MSNEIEINYQKYLRHQKGLALLWLWMNQWKSLNGWTWEDNSLTISNLCSQRFLIGAPKNKSNNRSKNVFLGIQHEENSWMKRIIWKRVVMDKSNQKLWLVSQNVFSPDIDWPDIPSIAVGVSLKDNPHLGNWEGPKMDLRGVWWEDDGSLRVDINPYKTCGVFVGSLDQHWSKKERQNVITLRDIVNSKISRTNKEENPGFKGDIPVISGELSKLTEEFKSNEKIFLIEENYKELFGQFIDEEDPRNAVAKKK